MDNDLVEVMRQLVLRENAHVEQISQLESSIKLLSIDHNQHSEINNLRAKVMDQQGLIGVYRDTIDTISKVLDEMISNGPHSMVGQYGPLSIRRMIYDMPRISCERIVPCACSYQDCHICNPDKLFIADVYNQPSCIMCGHLYICEASEIKPVTALCGCTGVGYACIDQSGRGMTEAFSRCGLDPTVVKCWKCRV
jgi:hypothetical protein